MAALSADDVVANEPQRQEAAQRALSEARARFVREIDANLLSNGYAYANPCWGVSMSWIKKEYTRRGFRVTTVWPDILWDGRAVLIVPEASAHLHDKTSCLLV